ncbi:MAG: hypothetical protein U1A28_04600 [Patescibacteria group bacterium]|nr:hypothetical protein [Patescibacteria group bacterium]
MVIWFRNVQKIDDVQKYAESVAPTVIVTPMFGGIGITEEMKRYITANMPDGTDVGTLIDKLDQQFGVEGFYPESPAEPATRREQ